METMQNAFANCLRLHVFEKPSVDSEVVCKLRYLTELEVDLEASTEGFYKVYTAIDGKIYHFRRYGFGCRQKTRSAV